MDDLRIAREGPRPLHGIPVLIKDNIDTGDGMQTSAGSLALVGRPAPTDSTVAANCAPGSRHHRQDELVRMGELPLVRIDQRMVRPRRADE